LNLYSYTRKNEKSSLLWLMVSFRYQVRKGPFAPSK